MFLTFLFLGLTNSAVASYNGLAKDFKNAKMPSESRLVGNYYVGTCYFKHDNAQDLFLLYPYSEPFGYKFLQNGDLDEDFKTMTKAQAKEDAYQAVTMPDHLSSSFVKDNSLTEVFGSYSPISPYGRLELRATNDDRLILKHVCISSPADYPGSGCAAVGDRWYNGYSDLKPGEAMFYCEFSKPLK